MTLPTVCAAAERGFRDCVAGVSGVNCRLCLGFGGSSRNSWSRTFVTNAARRISTVGSSLRDVQLLAGHSALSTTQRYIEADAMAQRKVVELVWGCPTVLRRFRVRAGGISALYSGKSAASPQINRDANSARM